MKRRKIPSRLLAWLLAVVMIAGIMPTTFARPAEITSITLYGSDKVTWYTADSVDSVYYPDVEITASESPITVGGISCNVQSVPDNGLKLTPSSAENFSGMPMVLVLYMEIEGDGEKNVSVLINDGPVPIEYDELNSDQSVSFYKVTLSLSPKKGEVTVKPVIKNPPVTVSFGALSGSGYILSKHKDASAAPELTNQVESGSSFQFAVTITGDQDAVPYVEAHGRTSGTVTPLDNPKPEMETSRNKYNYKLSNVTENTLITVEVRQPVTVSFTQGTGYTISADNKTNKVPYGGDFPFTVKPDNGYDIQVFEGASSKPLKEKEIDEAGNYKYTLEKLTENTTITVKATLRTYTITVDGDKGTGFTTTAHSTTIQHGGTFTFTVTPEPGYDAPNVSISGATETPVNFTSSNGNYSIPNITQNINIQIGSATLQQRTVNFPPIKGIKYKFSGEDATSASVNYNTDLNFDIIVEAGYNKSTPVVRFNGETLSASAPGDSEGEKTYHYTIKNVTTTGELTVTGITINTYTAKIETPESGGYSYAVTNNRGSLTDIPYGGTLTFTVTPATGYKNPTVKVTYNGEDEKTINAVSGTYSIPDIKTDVTIKIEGEIQTFTVTEPEEPRTGYSFEATSDTTVNYGGSYGFTVTPKVGYTITNVYTVYGESNRIPLRADSTDGTKNTYSITSITQDVKIEVEAREVRVTVVLRDSKDVSQLQTKEYTITGNEGSPTIKLPTPKGADDFRGVYECSWQDRSGISYSTIEIGNADVTYDLSAVYKINWEKVYSFTLTYQWYGPGDNGRYAIQIKVNSTVSNVSELEDVDVAGFGIFYSGEDFTDYRGSLTTYLNGVGGGTDPLGIAFSTLPQNSNVKCYNGSFLTTFNKSGTTSYSINIGGYSEKPTQKYAQPWLVLLDKNNATRHVILGNKVETLTPNLANVEDEPSMEAPSAEPALEQVEELEKLDERVEEIDQGLEPIPDLPQPVPVPVTPAVVE